MGNAFNPTIIVSVIAVVVVVLLLAARRGPKACPQCGTALAAIRRPTSFRQLLWGGWTCAQCGTEIDRRGRKNAR